MFIELNVTTLRTLICLLLCFCKQSGPVNIIVGSHVWIEDPKLAWIDGEVFRINGEEIHVRTTNGKTVSHALSS